MVVTTQNPFDVCEAPMVGTESDRARALRLKQLRAFMGYGGSGPRFAAFLGVSYPRYNNAERGLPLSRQMAEIIVRKCPGITTDWLNYGSLAGLPTNLIRGLAEAPKAKTSAD